MGNIPDLEKLALSIFSSSEHTHITDQQPINVELDRV